MSLFNLLFSSLSQLWYVEVRISRSVSVSPLEFEITGVDCIQFSLSCDFFLLILFLFLFFIIILFYLFIYLFFILFLI